MQAVESQTLILYHTDLRGEWRRDAARALAARLPYAKRFAPGGLFPGAAACVMTSFALSELTVRALSLQELFAR